MFKTIATLLLLVGAVLYGLMGLYNVEPDETAVVYFLGSVSEPEVGPGMHWNFSPPFGRQVILKTKTNLIMPVGYNNTNEAGGPVFDNDIWMTAGASLIQIRLDIQYSIARLDQYILSHNDPTAFMRLTAEKALTRFLIANEVDDVLTTGRQLLRGELQQRIQKEMHDARTGIKIQDVIIVELSPPYQGRVANAFQKVQSARSDRDRRIEDARSERSQLLFTARSEADRIVNLGRSDSFARQEKARGQASRFSALAKEYATAPGVTERRIYLERMSKILKKAKLYIMPNGTSGQGKLIIKGDER